MEKGIKNNTWLCKNCLEYRDEGVLQCYCGNWKNDETRLEYIGSFPRVFKAINILNKSFMCPRDEKEVISNEMLNSFLSDYRTNIIRKVRKKELEDRLQKIGHWILDFFGCKNEDTLFHFNYVDNDTNGKAGQYDNKAFCGFKNITINLSDYYSVESIIYIMAHECMHRFLFEKNIVIDNVLENEILTDTAVVYFGFGTFIEKGSGKLQISDRYEYSYSIGYLDANEIGIIRQYVNNRYWQFQNYRKIVLKKREILMGIRISELKKAINKTKGVEIEQIEVIRLIEYSSQIRRYEHELKELNYTTEKIDYFDKIQVENICKRIDKVLKELKDRINHCKRIVGESCDDWNETILINGLNRNVTWPINYYNEKKNIIVGNAKTDKIKTIIINNKKSILYIGVYIIIVLMVFILVIKNGV